MEITLKIYIIITVEGREGIYTECELSNLEVLIHIQSKYGKEGGQGYGLLLRPCKVISTTVKRRVGNSAFAHLFF